MKRITWGVSVCFVLIAAVMLASCGSGPTLSLSAMGSASPAIDDAQVITITATTNSSQGVTWTLTGAGALSNNTATTVTYTAPATGGTTATVTAALVSTPSKTASITLTVTAPPSITTTTLPGAVVGTAYSGGQIAATGGASPLKYSVSVGSLPAGLTLNSSSGAITGTPTGPASTTPVSFTATVTDSSTVAPQTATQALSITVSQAPAITSANAASFVVNTSGSFTVNATGVPVPALTETGALPSGVTFKDNGNGTGTLSGTPATGTAANYTITFTANNGVGTAATQNFTLTVGQPPAITSAGSTTFTVGAAGTFSITTSGFPAPSLSETGALPSGVTFKDNGNGTATLSGTPAAGTGKQYSMTITASNGVGSNASQSFTLTVDETPAISSANKTTFTVLTLGTFSVTTSGYPTASIAESGTLPTGVTFVDNGNGTGTLAGTPASGTAGNYPITFTPSNGVGSPVAQSFTLTVGQAPAITSGTSTTFTVGSPGTFTVTTTGFPKPTLSETGALPSGVTFVDNGDGTATLSGTPAAGTGKAYAITVTATNGIGSNATQSFTLTVDEAPGITSANSATFSVGGNGTFQVTTSGFPAPTTSESGTLPNGVTFTDNGNGTGTLSGTPASGTAGSYPITFTASNGIGTNASQSFTLTVNTAPVISSANNTTFTAGTSGSFTITATGNPTPTISETGTLPSGVTFAGGTGSATLSGTPGTGTGGTYTITFTASNGVGTNATQTFTLTVDEAPAITSANNATLTEGTFGSFTVTATGTPAPSISTPPGSLPSGVTFVDNGNGTGTLSGTPATGTSSSSPYNFTFTASNGVGSNATQSFTLTVNTAPVFSSANNTTFTAGASGSFTITATGNPTPSLAESGNLPSGVTFTDNGNGTATLSGTAATGTGGVYNITINAKNTSGTTSQSFALTVNEAPAFNSSASATFFVGQIGNFQINATGYPQSGMTISDGGATLPNGVTFTDNGNGSATLSGAPASGTTGTYNITFTATNTTGTGTQSFTLTVSSDPCASFSSGNESLLSGSYALLLKGFDDGNFSGENGQQEPALVGGVLTFNGTNNSGSVTAGAIDLNLNGTKGLDSLTVNSGTYKVGSDHRACMALNLSDGSTEHYAVSLGGISGGVSSTGHMISFDGSSGTGTVYATGTLKKQTATTLSAGNFAFMMGGPDNTAQSGSISGAIGILKLSNGNVTGGEGDSNDGGAIDKNCGTYTAWPSTPCYSISSGGTYTVGSNGRGTLTFTATGGSKTDTLNMEIYVVSATDFFILQNSDQTQNTVSAGEALQQSGSFSNGSLNGTGVYYQIGFDCGGNNCTIDKSNPNGTAGSNTVLARFSANGSGSASGTFYANSSGNIQTASFTGATYTVDSNGRAVMSVPNAGTQLLYLVGSNHAWGLGSDNGVGMGAFESQTATSVSGTFAVGGIDPVVPSGVNEVIATFASGSVNATSDNNDPGGTPQTQGQTISVSVDSTGFGVLPTSGSSCTPTVGDCQFIFYVISPTRFVGMDGGLNSNPKLQPADQ